MLSVKAREAANTIFKVFPLGHKAGLLVVGAAAKKCRMICRAHIFNLHFIEKE